MCAFGLVVRYRICNDGEYIKERLLRRSYIILKSENPPSATKL